MQHSIIMDVAFKICKIHAFFVSGEPNSAVVAVVGIGHMKGIVKNWECAQDADIQELCRSVSA